MGDDAAQRAATADEIAQMQAIVRDAMAHGAVGFASSTSPAHNGEGGLPMPSRLAERRARWRRSSARWAKAAAASTC